MSRLALIRIEDDTVVNLIEVEEGANWSPPDGHTTVSAGDARFGDTFVNGTLIPKPPPTQKEIDAVIDARKEAILTQPFNTATMKADSKRRGIPFDEIRQKIKDELEV